MRIRHSNFDTDPVRVTVFYCLKRELPWYGIVADASAKDLEDPTSRFIVDKLDSQWTRKSNEIVCYFILGPTQLKRVVKALNRGLIDPTKLTYPSCGGKYGGESRIDIFSYARFNGVF